MVDQRAEDGASELSTNFLPDYFSWLSLNDHSANDSRYSHRPVGSFLPTQNFWANGLDAMNPTPLFNTQTGIRSAGYGFNNINCGGFTEDYLPGRQLTTARCYSSNGSLNRYDSSERIEAPTRSYGESLSSASSRYIVIFHPTIPDLHIIQLAKSKEGSLFLQNELSKPGSRISDSTYRAVCCRPFDLISDGFGHYLFSKVIQSCDMIQLVQITFTVIRYPPLFLRVCAHKHGSQSTKRMIQRLKEFNFTHPVTDAISIGIMHIMNDRIASSVVLYCLDILDNEQNQFIYEAVKNEITNIATHANGCIALNKFIGEMKGPSRREILLLISNHARFLSKDPYGNHVLQHVLRIRDPEVTLRICNQLKGEYAKLAMLKYGSHVVENCLLTPGMAEHVIRDFLRLTDHQLLSLATDKFANFVVQTALKVTQNDRDMCHHLELCMKLKNVKHLESGYGKHVQDLLYQLEAFYSL